MKVKYKIPDGLAVSGLGSNRSVRALDGDAYQLTDLTEGTKEVWSYHEVLNLIEMSGARLKQSQPKMTKSAARIRDGVLQYIDSILMPMPSLTFGLRRTRPR